MSATDLLAEVAPYLVYAGSCVAAMFGEMDAAIWAMLVAIFLKRR